MKTLFSAVGLCLFLVVAAAANGAGIPTMNVTVSDAAGKLAYKGATKSNGGFATEKLQPGNYVVQLTSKDSALKSGQYSIVVSAGKKKVVASAVSGQKFLSGGVAVKVDVGAGLNITGQVTAGPLTTVAPQTNDKMKKPGDAQESARQNMTQSADKMTAPVSH
jgi:hypothetical protein